MEFYSRELIAELDEVAINKYGVSVEKLMENAGGCVARFVIENFSDAKRVVIVYGKGNNAGDGLVAARHLNGYGMDVKILGLNKELLNDYAKKEFDVLEKAGVLRLDNLGDLKKGDVVVDSLFGFNLNSEPGGNFRFFIEEINKARERGVKVVSVDVPSGVDSDKGEIYDCFVKADCVLMLALAKKGLKHMNNLWIGNIGIPKKVYEGLNIKPIEFKKEFFKV